MTHYTPMSSLREGCSLQIAQQVRWLLQLAKGLQPKNRSTQSFHSDMMLNTCSANVARFEHFMCFTSTTCDGAHSAAFFDVVLNHKAQIDP